MRIEDGSFGLREALKAMSSSCHEQVRNAKSCSKVSSQWAEKQVVPPVPSDERHKP